VADNASLDRASRIADAQERVHVRLFSDERSDCEEGVASSNRVDDPVGEAEQP